MVDRHGKAQALWRALLQGRADGEVFKHQQTVEQRFTGTPGPALHIAQRGKFMLAQLKVMRLQTAQPLRHTFSRLGLSDHRQGVDKQPELVFCTRQIHWAPGHGCAKRYGLLTAVTLQQHRPSALHQGVEGDAVLAGKGIESLAARPIEHLLMIRVLAAV